MTYSNKYKSLILTFLVFTYTFNFIDRTIISIVGEAIKQDLNLSDTALGLLVGFYFAILYSILGIPLARLSERNDRVSIIAICLAIWSVFTAVSGLATSYLYLALCRLGVGIGEAGCTPPSHSLISDYFPPHQRSRALSIYSLGIPLGIMFGAFLGGFLTAHFSWRTALFIVGVPGVLLSIAARTFLEDPRIRSDKNSISSEFSLKGELSELIQVSLSLFRSWPMLNVISGLTIGSFVAYGSSAFIAPFFVRLFAIDFAKVGLIVGTVFGVGSGIGILLGGFLTDALGRRNKKYYVLMPAACLCVAAGLFFSAFLQNSWWLAALLLFCGSIFQYTYLGPTFALVQNSVSSRQRATASAIVLLIINLIGLGLGPFALGWLIDLLASSAFVKASIGNIDPPSFFELCPGGKASANSAPSIQINCANSINLATQTGLALFSLLFAWAGLHYFLASVGLKKQPQR